MAEGEAGSIHLEADVGFDPGSPGSRHGPKAGAKLLHHPGIPTHSFQLHMGHSIEHHIIVDTSSLIRIHWGIPGWRSGLAPAFGPGRDPGDRGSNPTSGSRCMEPASPSACVSASLSLSLSLSLCDYHK